MAKASSRVEALARRLKTPLAVQRYLQGLRYNHEPRGPTLRSAEGALRIGAAHCLEATFIAAAVLERHGFPPLCVSFESQDELDHVLFAFKEKGCWGAVAFSRDEGLHGRPPVFRSIRDLTWSYYDPFVDRSGKITAYQLVHLDDTKTDWRASRTHVFKAERYLLRIKHRPLRSSKSRYKRLLADYRRRGPMPRQKHWW